MWRETETSEGVQATGENREPVSRIDQTSVRSEGRNWKINVAVSRQAVGLERTVMCVTARPADVSGGVHPCSRHSQGDDEAAPSHTHQGGRFASGTLRPPPGDVTISNPPRRGQKSVWWHRVNQQGRTERTEEQSA